MQDYNQDVTAEMALLCAITYVQFIEYNAARKINRNAPVPNVDQLTFESVTLPALRQREQDAIKGYNTVANFVVRDSNWWWLASREERQARNMMQRLFWMTMKLQALILLLIPFLNAKEVFGFALEPDNDDAAVKANIIALRGTQDADEWLVDASLLQIPYGLADHQDGKVHGGFASLYSELKSQIHETIRQFKDTSLPLIITGHSLGAALATLAAIDIAHEFSDMKPQLVMINFASPKVGNKTFATEYNRLVPNSFRVVNLADVVPMMPPTDIEIGKEYSTVGIEYAYLNQRDSLAGNHSITENYWDAVVNGKPNDAKRNYPIKAID